MIKLKFNIILSLYLLCIASFLACTGGDDTVKAKNWSILYSDDESLENAVNNKEWKPVQVPSTFKLPHFKEKQFRHVWIAGEFDIGGSTADYYGISTGRMRLTDSIFINSKAVGSLPIEDISWNPLPRNYVIPEKILVQGRNSVYIRLGIYGRYHGGIMGDAAVQTKRTFKQTKLYNIIIYKYIPIGMIFIFASLIIPMIIIFLVNPKEKLPLYALLGIFVYIIYSTSRLASIDIISYENYTAVLMSLIPLFSLALMYFIQSIYKVYLSNHNRVIVPVNILFMIVMIYFRKSEYNFTIGFIITNISILIIIPYIAFIIYRLNKLNPDRYLLNLIGIMSILVGLVMMFEFYAEYFGIIYTDIPATYSPLVFFIIFAFLFSREIMKRRIHLEFLYDKLKGIEGAGKGMSITETAEEKLKRMIKFIDENFTSDISREGLASAVELNPNYMCTLFKSYTGRTLHEYISNLRVQKAVGLLEEGRLKIIDIAFEVGFENSVTFNRVFKKVTGKTPSDFRSAAE